MVLLGLGMGLTSAPATESVMGAVSDGRAGVGSAVNDAAREVGGTLGVAVIGSFFASLYAARLDEAVLPAPVREAAGDSVGAALAVAAQSDATLAGAVRTAAEAGFLDGSLPAAWSPLASRWPAASSPGSPCRPGQPPSTRRSVRRWLPRRAPDMGGGPS